eukprot:748127-Hanusia_phi.AAC.2
MMIRIEIVKIQQPPRRRSTKWRVDSFCRKPWSTPIPVTRSPSSRPPSPSSFPLSSFPSSPSSPSPGCCSLQESDHLRAAFLHRKTHDVGRGEQGLGGRGRSSMTHQQRSDAAGRAGFPPCPESST